MPILSQTRVVGYITDLPQIPQRNYFQVANSGNEYWSTWYNWHEIHGEILGNFKYITLK